MNKNLAYAGLISAALMGSAAYAQSTGATNPTADQQANPGQQAQTQPGGVTFVTEQGATWRAPKLIGVAVYGADDQKIGTIKDVLIGHDGATQVVVIGVGGFLGFGTKNVAVPFTAVQWRTEARSVPDPTQPPTNPAGSTSGSGGKPAMKQIDPAVAEASQGYPDKAVLPVTLAELKSAPDFHYAPSPLADLDTRPAVGSVSKSTP
jgi:sporulation protein YlmC with PRC-barrel domain